MSLRSSTIECQSKRPPFFSTFSSTPNQPTTSGGPFSLEECARLAFSPLLFQDRSSSVLLVRELPFFSFARSPADLCSLRSFVGLSRIDTPRDASRRRSGRDRQDTRVSASVRVSSSSSSSRVASSPLSPTLSLTHPSPRSFLAFFSCRITITMLNAFLSAALAATGHFCFASVASGSVVLVLPGYLFLAGSLGSSTPSFELPPLYVRC